jgi:hypothetical protein
MYTANAPKLEIFALSWPTSATSAAAPLALAFAASCAAVAAPAAVSATISSSAADARSRIVTGEVSAAGGILGSEGDRAACWSPASQPVLTSRSLSYVSARCFFKASEAKGRTWAWRGVGRHVVVVVVPHRERRGTVPRVAVRRGPVIASRLPRHLRRVGCTKRPI